jgi:hypothetical protein
MQLILIFVVIINIQSPFKEEWIEGLEIWRSNIGHDANYFDKLTMTSLKERVCSSTEALEMSDEKANLVSAMETYLPSNDLMGLLSSGPSVCLVAALIWTCTVMSELLECSCLFIGIWEMQRGRKTTVKPCKEESLQLSELSMWRKTFALFIISL